MRWRKRVLVCLLSLIAVVPDILSTIIKDIISFQSESDHWCHSPSQCFVHHRPNNGNVCNNKRYDLIWMLLTEDMRGWISISQYHMNCYHGCLSFSLQILSWSRGLFGRVIKSHDTAWLTRRSFSKRKLYICLHLFLASANPSKHKNVQSVILMWIAATHLLFRKSVTTTRWILHYLINIHEPGSLFRLFLRLWNFTKWILKLPPICWTVT